MNRGWWITYVYLGQAEMRYDHWKRYGGQGTVDMCVREYMDICQRYGVWG